MALRCTDKYNFILDIHNIEWTKTLLNPNSNINTEIHNEFINIVFKILRNEHINWNTNLAKQVANLKIGDFIWKWKIIDIGGLESLGDIKLFQPKRL